MSKSERLEIICYVLGILAIFTLVQSPMLYAIGIVMAISMFFRLREKRSGVEQGSRPLYQRNKIIYFLALLIIFGVIFLVRSLDGEIRDFDITEYEKATVVGILGNSEDKIKIAASTGVNATIFFVSINSVALRFQDEEKEREIYHTLFIQSAETRQSGEKDIIFIKISGWYMTRLNEEEKEEKIFVYNLSKRKLVGWAKIK